MDGDGSLRTAEKRLWRALATEHDQLKRTSKPTDRIIRLAIHRCDFQKKYESSFLRETDITARGGAKELPSILYSFKWLSFSGGA